MRMLFLLCGWTACLFTNAAYANGIKFCVAKGASVTVTFDPAKVAREIGLIVSSSPPGATATYLMANNYYKLDQHVTAEWTALLPNTLTLNPTADSCYEVMAMAKPTPPGGAAWKCLRPYLERDLPGQAFFLPGESYVTLLRVSGMAPPLSITKSTPANPTCAPAR
jgi:hypothetical protein